jgi:hypothetical protein
MTSKLNNALRHTQLISFDPQLHLSHHHWSSCFRQIFLEPSDLHAVTNVRIFIQNNTYTHTHTHKTIHNHRHRRGADPTRGYFKQWYRFYVHIRLIPHLASIALLYQLVRASRYSLYSYWLWAGRSADQSSIPCGGGGGDWEFFSSTPCPDRLWDPPSLLSNGYRGDSFHGGKAAGV